MPSTCSIAATADEKMVKINCLKCGYVKNYPTKEYSLWLENPECEIKETVKEAKRPQNSEAQGQSKKKQKKERKKEEDPKLIS